jgi:hypothetical protein
VATDRPYPSMFPDKKINMGAVVPASSVEPSESRAQPLFDCLTCGIVKDQGRRVRLPGVDLISMLRSLGSLYSSSCSSGLSRSTASSSALLTSMCPL